MPNQRQCVDQGAARDDGATGEPAADPLVCLALSSACGQTAQADRTPKDRTPKDQTYGSTAAV